VATPVASPTYSPDLAQALLALLDAPTPGIVHVANRGGCSRIDLAREVIRALGPAFRTEVDERPEDPGPPRRPRYCVLDTRRFEASTGRPLRTWSDAVAEYVELGSR
jgi:dTDP-4-dehydrorhamnose reductase